MHLKVVGTLHPPLLHSAPPRDHPAPLSSRSHTLGWIWVPALTSLGLEASPLSASAHLARVHRPLYTHPSLHVEITRASQPLTARPLLLTPLALPQDMVPSSRRRVHSLSSCVTSNRTFTLTGHGEDHVIKHSKRTLYPIKLSTDLNCDYRHSRL